MAIFTIKKTITEDESAGLQTSGVATATEDNNDDDVASLPSAISSQLSTALSGDSITPPPPVTGFFPSYAEVDGFATVDAAGATLGDIFFSDGNGAVLNGFDSGLTTDAGNKILLYTSSTDDNAERF